MLGRVLLHVRPYVVGLGRFVQLRHRPYRVVDQPHDVREGVPEESGDADGDVDARPAQFLHRHHLEARHPARGVVPHRTAPEQRQDLGDVVTLGAHRGRAPDREADGRRILSGVVQVPPHQRVRQRLPDLPAQPRRNRLGVDGVEVPAGRQHVDQTARRRTGRSGGHVTAVQRPQDVPDLVRRPLQPGHDLLAREPQHGHRVGEFHAQHLPYEGSAFVRRPAALLHPLGDPPAQLLQQVDRVGGRPRRAVHQVRQLHRNLHRSARLGQQLFLHQPEVRGQRGPQPRQRVRPSAPHLRGTQHRQDEVHARFADRAAAQDVQAVADLHVLDLAQIAVDVHDELVEVVVVRLVVHVQVVVELGGLHQRPDLRPYRRCLRRVQVGDQRVLVEQLLQLGEVPVRVGPRHRRHQVIDDRGVPAPFRLCPLAGVVHDERVDQRQVAEDRVRRAPGAQAQPLARQPLHRAVLAHVHEGVGAEAVLQPAVGRQVVMRRRHVRVVVDRDRVLAEAARRLDHHHDVPEPERGEDDVLPVDVQRPRRLAPRLTHPLPELRVQLLEPRPVVRQRHPRGRRRHLVLRQPLHVVAAGLDEPVDQLVALGGVVGDPVARLPQRVQHPHRRGRGVQPHRVADPRVLRRVGGEDQRQFLLGVRLVPECRVANGDPGHPRGPLRVGDVDRDVVGALLLEGERDRDEAAVELRDGDLHRRVHGGQGRVGLLPRGARRGQAEPLQHRHVQVGERPDVPGLLVTARRRLRGVRAAGREYGGDQRVGPRQQLVQPRVGAAQ